MSTPSLDDALPQGRVPSLVLPFAAVGVAAVCYLLDFDDGLLARITMGVAAVTAGTSGGILTRYCRRSASGEFPRRALGVRLALLILASGAVTGSVIGALAHWPSRGFDSFLSGALDGFLNGALYAGATLPLHALVLWVALRAERPRHGSIVARSELRAIAAVLLSVFTLLAARHVGGWRWTPPEEMYAPWPPYAVAWCAALLSLGLVAWDAMDLQRVARLARDRTLEPHAGTGDTVPRVDLGVGDESVAQMARGEAYRSVARPVEVVQGSFPHALRALRLALARDLAVLVFAGWIVFLHAWDRGPAGRRANIAFLAGHGVPAACVAEARWLEARDGAASRARVSELYGRACKGGDGDACEAAAARYEAEGALALAADHRSHLCDMRSGRACYEAGVLLVSAGVEPTLAFDRFVKACAAGVPEACCEGAYLAHHGEGTRYVARNTRVYLGGSGQSVPDDTAADARYTHDLYRRAVTFAHRDDARCVALRAEGFVDPVSPVP